MRLTSSLAEKIEGIVGIVVSVIVYVLRYIVAIATNSLALLVDAWHALIDALTSGIVIAASLLADKPADEEHPYGHGRALAVGSNIIGVIVTALGVMLLYEVVQRYLSASTITSLATVTFMQYLLIVTCTGIVKLAQWVFARYLGVKYSSRLCLADAKHHLADGIITFFVAFSMTLLYYTHMKFVDLIAAVAICILIVREGLKIMKESTSILLDRSVPSLAKRVEEVVKHISGIRGIRNIKVRDYGRYYVAEVDILLDPKLSLREAHQLAHVVEHEIRRRIPEIHHVHTHYAPEDDENVQRDKDRKQ